MKQIPLPAQTSKNGADQGRSQRGCEIPEQAQVVRGRRDWETLEGERGVTSGAPVVTSSLDGAKGPSISSPMPTTQHHIRSVRMEPPSGGACSLSQQTFAKQVPSTHWDQVGAGGCGRSFCSLGPQ